MNTKNNYISYKEAQKALKAYCLPFKTSLDYRTDYKSAHPNLPSNPERVYSEWNGWKAFLGGV